MARSKDPKPPSGSKRETSRAEAGFQGEFGDFHAVRAVRMQCGASPNGHYVGMRFELAGGETVKVSIPLSHAQEFASDCESAIKAATDQLGQNYDDPAGIA